jgi:hypothetical protein
MNNDFLGMESEGSGEDDAKFQELMWSQLPEHIQERFKDERQVGPYMRKVEKSLKEHGLVMERAGLGIDPMSGRVVFRLECAFDEGEEQFQTDKELAKMMYDEKLARDEELLNELREAAKRGDKGALGL